MNLDRVLFGTAEGDGQKGRAYLKILPKSKLT